MTEKERIIEAILEIELAMFLTVNPSRRAAARNIPRASSCTGAPSSTPGRRRRSAATWTTCAGRRSAGTISCAKNTPACRAPAARGRQHGPRGDRAA